MKKKYMIYLWNKKTKKKSCYSEFRNNQYPFFFYLPSWFIDVSPTNYRGHIQKHMEPYKIGEVTKADMAVITSNTYYDDSAYENNPPPYPDLLVNTRYFKYHSYALAYMARLPKCKAKAKVATKTEAKIHELASFSFKG